jgi:hypothetical protein
MSIPFDKILVRHWVRSHATQVNRFFEKKQIVKKDFRIYYVKMADCVHVDALKTSNYTVYNEYVSTSNQFEHTEATFKKLLVEWDPRKLQKLDITYDGEDFYVSNGVHRLAILYILNGPNSQVPIDMLNIQYPKSTIDTIEKALKSTTKLAHYNGWANSRTEYGYHSFNLFNINFTGQRNPLQRLTKMRNHYNFKDKTVIDIGCNSGGMLFHLLEIKQGLGIDFDKNCINACGTIKQNLHVFEHLAFLEQDLDKDDITAVFKSLKPDVVLLLSMGSWLKNWRELYELVLEERPVIFLETNNDKEGIPQLCFFEEKGCQITLVSDKSDDDTTGNLSRKMYAICL